MDFKEPCSAQRRGSGTESWGLTVTPPSGRSSGAAGETTDLGHSDNPALLQRMDPARRARLFRSQNAMKQVLSAEVCCTLKHTQACGSSPQGGGGKPLSGARVREKYYTYGRAELAARWHGTGTGLFALVPT